LIGGTKISSGKRMTKLTEVIFQNEIMKSWEKVSCFELVGRWHLATGLFSYPFGIFTSAKKPLIY